MIMIDNSTAVAYNHADLSGALSADNGIDYIYLGANITMSAGIRVNPAKRSVVIDGLYPPESPDIRTLTDQGGDGGQIYMNSVTATGIEITFQNLIINGLNYYGMPYIHDVTNAEKATVTYINVTYTGPQMTWHVRGLARYIDCDITIMYAGRSPMNEVAEINRVEIGGTTRMRHNNTALYAVFYFYNANPYFTVLENADVEISTMRDFLYHEGSYYVPFTIGSGASLTITTQRGMSRDQGHRAASVLVEENASFRYIRETATGNAHALYVNGAFTVREGANVYMQADFENSGSLIRFASNAGGLYVDNPKSFVIYNRGSAAAAAAFSFTSVIPFILAGQQLNFWRVARPFPVAGGFDDVPLYKWNRPSWEAFRLEGTSGSSQTNITGNDFTPEELQDLPPLTALKLFEARVLSIGNLPLSLSPIMSGMKPITGTTAGRARVRAVFIVGGSPVEGVADETGYFLLTPEVPVPLSGKVTVSANTPFLIVSLVRTAQQEGELAIANAPEFIRFAIRPLSGFAEVILPRQIPEDVVTVKDTRSLKTEWTIWARILGPFRTEEGEVLKDAVVFRLENGDMPPLSAASIAVHTDGPYEDESETDVKWDIDRGVLGRIGEPIRSGKMYSTELHWSVYPVGVEPDEEDQA